MREILLRIFAVAVTATLLFATAHAQQSRWASADDKTAKYMIEMESKWAEGVCVDNGVVAGLLADDFQGTSTNGVRFTKADELKDEKSARTAHVLLRWVTGKTERFIRGVRKVCIADHPEITQSNGVFEY